MAGRPSTSSSIVAFFRPVGESGEPERESYRFFVVTHFIYIFSCIGHASFILLFLILSVDVLVLYNIVSCLVFVGCIALNKRGNHLTAFYVAAVEVVLHASLCAMLIGWSTGFHYFIVGMIPFTMLLPGASLLRKVTLTLIVLGVYGAVYFFSNAITPPYRIGESIQTALNYANLVINFGAFSVLVHYLVSASLRAEERVVELSRTDFLTRLLNRRGMMEHIDAEFATFHRTGRVFAILLGDLDNFKQLNDRYGHGCGDTVLVSVADLLRRSLRAQDRVCRWGGEEFLIVLPETGPAGARSVAENLLTRFREHRTGCGGNDLGVTITLGGVACRRGLSIDQMIVCADEAMYLGKEQGKDRVVICSDTLGGRGLAG